MPMIHAAPECDRRPRTAPVEVSFPDPLAGGEWDRLAGSHPGHTLFHLSAWARVLHNTYGHRPFYFVCSMGTHPAALIPLMEVRSALTGRRGICLPFSDFCAPLFFVREAAVRDSVFATLSSLMRERRWKHWEVRGSDESCSMGTPDAAFYAHTLSLLDGPDVLFERFDPAVRRAIRKAEGSGLTVSVRRDREAMIEFYRLHVITRRRHGMPVQPLAFFLNIHREVIETGLGSVVIAVKDSQPVAGAVFFHSGSHGLYKFGASDERYSSLRANNLVMWTGIQSLCAGGFETLALGRTAMDHEGLRRYKLGWKTSESVVSYHRSQSGTLGRDSQPGAAFKASTAVISRLPLSVNRLLGRLLYPHLD
jgi:hypothetical protein